MKINKLSTLFLLAITFLLGIAVAWFMFNKSPPISTVGNANAAVTKPALDRDLVEVGEAARSGRIQIVSTRNTVVPQSGALPGKVVLNENKTARLSAPVTGRVLRVLKEPGDRVAVGELLAVIDAPELSGVQAEASKAQVDAGLKTSAAQRMQELYGVGAIALKELQAANAEAAQAQVELDRTRNRLRQLNSLSRNSSSFNLVSPIAGVVTERAVTTGQQVHAEESLNLFVISDLTHLQLLIDAPEAQANLFSINQVLELTIDGSSAISVATSNEKNRLQATIIRIGPSVDLNTRRVEVRAAINNEAGSFRPQMFVRAYGADSTPRTAFEVPISALATRGSESAIFVEQAIGKFRRIPVEILAQHPDRAWVKPVVNGAMTASANVVSQGALLLDSEVASR